MSGLVDGSHRNEYQLQLNNINNGLPVAGTGDVLSFGSQTAAGAYTVIVTDAGAPAAFRRWPVARRYHDQLLANGVHHHWRRRSLLGRQWSAGWVGWFSVQRQYQLQVNNANTGSPTAVTGGALSFGSRDCAVGTYIGSGDGCRTASAQWPAARRSRLNPTPKLLGHSAESVDLRGWVPDLHCEPEWRRAGLHLSLERQLDRIDPYHERGPRNSVTVTDSNGCTTVCSATLTVNPLPTVFNVTGGGSYCANGNGVAVGLDGSQSGVNYQLQINTVNTGSPITGTGSSLSFSNQTTAGTYTVVATDGTTGCISSMAGSATVSLTDPFACWQLQYFGCTNCPQADAAADPDGDGQNNLAEFSP